MATFNDIAELGKGQVASTIGAIYTTPTGKVAQVKTVILHNTNTTAENVRIGKGGTATSDYLLNISLAANETFEFSPAVPLAFVGDEVLYGLTTTASKVNYFVYGQREA